MKLIALLLLIAFAAPSFAQGPCPPGQDGIPIVNPMYVWDRWQETGNPWTASHEAETVGWMRRNGICYPGYEFSWNRYGGYQGYLSSGYPRHYGYSDNYGYWNGGVAGGVLAFGQLGLGVYSEVERSRTQREGMRLEYDLRRREQEGRFELTREEDRGNREMAREELWAERELTSREDRQNQEYILRNEASCPVTFRQGKLQIIILPPGAETPAFVKKEGEEIDIQARGRCKVSLERRGNLVVAVEGRQQ